MLMYVMLTILLFTNHIFGVYHLLKLLFLKEVEMSLSKNIIFLLLILLQLNDYVIQYLFHNCGYLNHKHFYLEII
jgi:hypothetical protein